MSFLNSMALVLVTFNMVPHGRYEPHKSVSDGTIATGNPIYDMSQPINGVPYQFSNQKHAVKTRPVTPAVTVPVIDRQICTDEWPPWPAIRTCAKTGDGASARANASQVRFESDNWTKEPTDHIKLLSKNGQNAYKLLSESAYIATNGLETVRDIETSSDRASESQFAKHSKAHNKSTAVRASTEQAANKQAAADTWTHGRHEARLASAMAYNTSPTPNTTDSTDLNQIRELKIFMSNLTNEYWAMPNHNHNHFTAHLSHVACIIILSMLWIVACVRASWHVGLTAYKMRQDLTATGNVLGDEEKQSADAAVALIALMQNRQACMHTSVYCICQRCKAWICPTCGMVTACVKACMQSDRDPMMWNNYQSDSVQIIYDRAQDLRLSMEMLDVTKIFEEMTLSLVEYTSSKYGAMNCHGSFSLGMCPVTGRPAFNNSAYTGPRNYLEPNHSSSVSACTPALDLLTRMMRSMYMHDIDSLTPVTHCKRDMLRYSHA